MISSNNLTGCGLSVSDCQNIMVKGNSLSDGTAYGANAEVELSNSQNVTVEANDITGNRTIPTNDSVGDSLGGISLDSGGPYYLYGNNIANNAFFGVQFNAGCYKSSVYSNNITQNKVGVDVNHVDSRASRGVWIGNEVYNNNIIDNSQNVFVAGHQTARSDVIAWDNGYVGNYWSSFQTAYPNASEVGNSGIWNTPYATDSMNTDRYPLISQVDISSPVPTPTPTPSPSIPEFPAWIILPIFMAATLLMIVFVKKRINKKYPIL
jgi:hypothetical protein